MAPSAKWKDTFGCMMNSVKTTTSASATPRARFHFSLANSRNPMTLLIDDEVNDHQFTRIAPDAGPAPAYHLPVLFNPHQLAAGRYFPDRVQRGVEGFHQQLVA